MQIQIKNPLLSSENKSPKPSIGYILNVKLFYSSLKNRAVYCNHVKHGLRPTLLG